MDTQKNEALGALQDIITDSITGHFFGPYEIKSIIPLERTTSQGKPAVKLIFVNKLQPSVELPLEVAQKVITEELSDLTKLRETRCTAIVENLIKVLLEAEVSLDDIPYCFDTVARSIEFSNKAAQEKMFGKKLYDMNLYDIDKLLRQV